MLLNVIVTDRRLRILGIASPEISFQSCFYDWFPFRYEYTLFPIIKPAVSIVKCSARLTDGMTLIDAAPPLMTQVRLKLCRMRLPNLRKIRCICG
jgi:hypothetical protein